VATEKHRNIMDTTAGLRPTRPPRVKELVAQAENFHFNTNINLKHWTRAAETLYQEVSSGEHMLFVNTTC
jgi:hypothetical protein